MFKCEACVRKHLIFLKQNRLCEIDVERWKMPWKAFGWNFAVACVTILCSKSYHKFDIFHYSHCFDLWISNFPRPVCFSVSLPPSLSLFLSLSLCVFASFYMKHCRYLPTECVTKRRIPTQYTETHYDYLECSKFHGFFSSFSFQTVFFAILFCCNGSSRNSPECSEIAYNAIISAANSKPKWKIHTKTDSQEIKWTNLSCN